jgi:membrane fusion protein, heavy metal efflux system
MKRSGLNNFIFIFSLLILTSCGNSVQEDKRNDVNSAGINQPVNEISFSQEQIEMANIQTGSLTMKNMSESVICNGQIEAPPHQKASVSVPMQGYVKQILVHSGEYVSKGKPLV